MPSKTPEQQRFFALVSAVKKGDVPAMSVSQHIRDAAANMDQSELDDFMHLAGAPKKKEE